MSEWIAVNVKKEISSGKQNEKKEVIEQEVMVNFEHAQLVGLDDSGKCGVVCANGMTITPTQTYAELRQILQPFDVNNEKEG